MTSNWPLVIFHVQITNITMNIYSILLIFASNQFTSIINTSTTRMRISKAIDNQNLPPTFGSAKLFQPLSSAFIGAHCQWEIRFNTAANRIPETITEIICKQPDTQCGGNYAYQCRQIRSKILVGYTEDENLMDLRNMTMNIGCSCVRRSSNMVSFLLPNHQLQKRASSRSERPIHKKLHSDLQTWNRS